MTQQLGKYELLRELGRGAYGTVYLAKDTVLDVERAVKVLHPQLMVDGALVERFRREAQLAARLEHPHIVPVYDFGEEGGRFYLAMRYMAGGSLKERLEREGALPWDEALRIARQVAEGLAYAHERGVVHRDLKPGNILFDEQGNARVSDFGFAKAVSGGASSMSLTATREMIGTPPYMAPELWKNKGVGPAVDQYALACIVAEMLTAEMLFGGDTPWEVIGKHKEGPRFPETWPEGVPGNVEAVLRKALAKAPEERYTDVLAFVDALEACQAEEEAEAAALQRAEEARKKAEEALAEARRKAEATQNASGERITLQQRGQELAEEIARRVRAEEARKKAEEALAEAPGKAEELAKIAQEQAKEKSMPPQAREQAPAAVSALKKTEEADKTAPLAAETHPVQETAQPPQPPSVEGGEASPRRSKVWGGLALALALVLVVGVLALGHRRSTTLPVLAGTPLPSGLARITASNAADVRELVRWDTDASVTSVAFSPDGTLLASRARDNTVRLWRVSDGALVRKLRGYSDVAFVGVRTVAFSPDGSLLAAGMADDTVRLWHVSDGALVRTLEGDMGGVSSVAFSPDGALLASGARDNTVRLWRVSDGALVRTLEGHTGNVESVVFSPDGRLLASGADDGTVRLWRVSDGALARTLEGHAGGVTSVTFSPDGSLLISGSVDHTVRLWWVSDGALARTLEGHTSNVESVAFSLDGSLLASGSYDGTVRLWRVSDGTLVRTLGGHMNGVTSVAFSPDGTLLASGSADGKVVLWGVP